MDGMVCSKTLNERLYQRKLSNGLNCYIIPKKDFREKSALVSIRYGEADKKYTRDKNDFQMPGGTAHFLEHRMFGNDYFERFARLGASVNAFTGLNVTAYYFNTAENFDECLSLLLEMVQNPHFTTETVNKEKDVIAQEIRMYADDPRWALYLNLMDSMFQVYPVKGNIAGTLESIASITPEILYECHGAFYTADNMNLVCAGELCPDCIYEMAEKLMHGEHCRKEIHRDYGHEPDQVAVNRVEASMALAGTMFSLGFKDIFFPKDVDIAEKIAVTKTVLDYVFGESSDLYEHLYSAALIDRPFESDFICGNFFGTAIVSSSANIYQSSNTDTLKTVSDSIFNEFDKIKSGSFDKSRFEHIIKKHIGRMARGFNNISNIVMSHSDMCNSKTSLFELADRYINLSPDDFLARLSLMFTRGNSVLSIVEPIS